MQFTHILFATATAALQSSAVLGTSSQFQPELPATHTHYHGHMILTGSHPNLTATVAPEPSQSGGIFPIIGYEEVLPDSNTPSNFGINQTWAHHHVLGQMVCLLVLQNIVVSNQYCRHCSSNQAASLQRMAYSSASFSATEFLTVSLSTVALVKSQEEDTLPVICKLTITL